MKLTTPEDFAREEARLGAALGDIRTGTGYDVHAFGDGDHLMICGVRVPHTRGFLAHSDGDVGLHALVDAILGALADGDIGSHFPPSDPQVEGRLVRPLPRHTRSSAYARAAAASRNLEVTLICERPKIGPLRDTMRARIAEIAGRADLARLGEGHHQRAARFHRPRGRHRGDRERDHPAAVGCNELKRADVSASDVRSLARALLDLCRMRKLTIATAESCTGGLVAAALTDIPGSSAVVDRGFVTYSNEAKHEMLGVRTTTLDDLRRGQQGDRRPRWRSARWRRPTSTSRSPSPASPAPAAPRPASRSDSFISRSPRATAG